MSNYPHTRKSDVVDDYNGVRVPDPYRWLEDLDSEETRAWIEEQNKVTFEFLDRIPQRKEIHDRLKQLWDFEKYGIPYREGNRYFYFKNDGLQNQSVLYTAGSLEDKPMVLLDPNALASDGTIALAGYAISRDGNLLAYGLAHAGSDWSEWRICNVETGVEFEDHLKWIKFSGVSWNADNSGFYYSRYSEPKPGALLEETNYYNKLYYHAVGTPQSADVLIYERPDHKEWNFSGYVTEDGRYLILTTSRGTDPKYLVSYRDLQSSNPEFTPLIDTFEAEYSFIANDATVFWFKTNFNAPRGMLIAIDIRNPSRTQWKEVIRESEDTLESVGAVDRKFILAYLKDARSSVRICSLAGEFLAEVDLPGIGTVGGFGGKLEDTETFYAFTSYSQPSAIYRYDMRSGQSAIFNKPVIQFNPDDYQTEQVFFLSKDGTRISMFIVHRKGVALNGNNRVYLYGYGGFNVSMTPAFSVSALVWMELGGVFAVANLRGGGEYGEEWHRAGTHGRKQNVFDDFIAAAEWLIANGYTNPASLAIGGGSNGGLLVTACMVQRPDLFGAVMPSVGVMDMLRFHKFTIGWAWVDDYGSPDNPDEFPILFAYSPLHNLKPGTQYPSVLITTGDHDDRVVPSHSFKFAAALQAAHTGKTPVLIRIETKAGHGAGKPTNKVIDEIADKWAFLTKVLA